MTRLEALRVLLTKVEAGEFGVDEFWLVDAHIGYNEAALCRDAFFGSLNEAMALHEALLTDMLWSITPMGNVRIISKQFDEFEEISVGACAGNVARAWLIAILRALIAQEEAKAGHSGALNKMVTPSQQGSDT